jgi:MFS family permease
VAGVEARSGTYARTVVLLLTLTYTLNSADRTLIGILAQPLKLDLKLSDAELGVLLGTAFATLYAFSGLFIARLAERFNRVKLISFSLVAWSCLTAACGLAISFPQLLLLRMGVGVGEAGCTPPAHSVISDYVPPERRSSALSVYSCGISLGYILSALLGGYLTQHYGWRTACVAIGLLGLPLSGVLARFVREPQRGYSEGTSAQSLPPLASGIRQELKEFGVIAARLFGKWSTGNVVIGVIIATFTAQGSYAFVPAYLNRAFALDYATIGVISALTGGVAVGVGLACGGYLTDRLGSLNPKWYALVPAIGLMTSTPLFALSFVVQDLQTSAWILAVAGFFQYLSFGPTFGIVQNAVSVRQRASATAIIYVFLTLFGLGCGPPFTGWLIDHFAQFNFSHPGAHTVGQSLEVWLAGGAGSSAVFRDSCITGGRMMEGSCSAALALATREGIACTVLLYAWAALHYFLGARGLKSVGAR